LLIEGDVENNSFTIISGSVLLGPVVRLHHEVDVADWFGLLVYELQVQLSLILLLPPQNNLDRLCGLVDHHIDCLVVHAWVVEEGNYYVVYVVAGEHVLSVITCLELALVHVVLGNLEVCIREVRIVFVHTNYIKHVGQRAS